MDWVVGWKGGERKEDGKKKGEEKGREVAAGGGGGDMRKLPLVTLMKLTAWLCHSSLRL